MMIDKIKKNLKTIIAIILTIIAAVVIYFNCFSTTEIAFVNYPEYLLAPLMDQEIPSNIQIDSLKWSEQSGKELKKYDMIIFFGMGLNFTEKQLELIEKLNTPLYVTASNRKETALNKLDDIESAELQNYLGNSSKANFLRMLHYIRVKLDGKISFAPIETAEEIIKSGYFHVDEEKRFRTYADFQNFYQSTPYYKADSPTVCILTGNNSGDLKPLIEELESKNLNVVGADGMGKFLDFIEEVKPAAVIYFPHGRLSMMNPEAGIDYLKKHNIPLFCPIRVNQEYSEFLQDQRGMTGGMLSQSITMAELDGGVAPFVISALFRNEKGLLQYQAIPDRVKKFATLVDKTVKLKSIPNKDKKIAIIYYKGPGKNAMVAGGLEVCESLFNTLKHLEKNSYNVGTLPKNAKELEQLIQANGSIFGSYAKGAEAKFLNNTERIEIDSEIFKSYLNRAVPADLITQIIQTHGEVPTIKLGGLKFGNILLLPQSAAGSGDDENKVIHGVKQIPPYRYMATYLYCQFGFEADAIMHFGTHGSLEFTPWKQLALSSYDWSDILIGSMPHYYLYTISNIGEAIIAKRRSYATIVSHLTPPFMQAESGGKLKELAEKMELYESAEGESLKKLYAENIKKIVVESNLHKDLKLSDSFASTELSAENFELIHEYIHEIESARVNRGLYVIGRPYSEAEAAETAELMALDLVANKLFEADVQAGKVAPEMKQNARFFDLNYGGKAKIIIQEALKNPQKFQKIESTANSAMPPSHPKTPHNSDEMQKIMQTGKLPDGREIPPAMRQSMIEMMAKKQNKSAPKQKTSSVELLAFEAKNSLINSTQAELDSMINAFNGGYIAPSFGGDAVKNPESVPTGRNMVGIDPDRLPTRESFEVGKSLAKALIEEKLKNNGDYPKKVAFTLWGGEFIRTQGTNIGEIFYLLGVEPIWDSKGRVRDIRLIPLKELGRPRIDVIVQTSGQFRSIATARMQLIDKAVKLAADDTDVLFKNYVRSNSLQTAEALVAKGMSAEQAKALANARIFGGVNGNFGTGVTEMIQSGSTWDDTKDIAQVYINNMGALYTEEHWGEHIEGVFEAALANTDTVVQSRSANTYGPLSLDHVYEFTGGISLAIKNINGKEADAYFNDLRNNGRATIQSVGQAVMVEARSTLLNEKYLKEMLDEGASAAASFAEAFQNTYGWEVTRENMIDDSLWEDYKKVYIDDSLKLGMKEFFETKNPYALQEMTGVMLESIRKGYWEASEETIKELAARHVELVEKFDAGCSGNVCNNPKLKAMILENISDENLKKNYNQKIDKVLKANVSQAKEVSGQTLKEETIELNKERENLKNRYRLSLISGVMLEVLLLFAVGRFRKKSINIED